MAIRSSFSVLSHMEITDTDIMYAFALHAPNQSPNCSFYMINCLLLLLLLLLCCAVQLKKTLHLNRENMQHTDMAAKCYTKPLRMFPQCARTRQNSLAVKYTDIFPRFLEPIISDKLRYSLVHVK